MCVCVCCVLQGMMHYEAALRVQAQLERVNHMELDEVLRMKFSYVVAAQVYGKMKKSQDGKAGDIEWLLHRYPNLRVAYIDEKPYDRRGGADFFSCLIKSAKTQGYYYYNFFIYSNFTLIY